MKAKELISKIKLNAGEFVLVKNTKGKILFDSRKPVDNKESAFDKEVEEIYNGVLGINVIVK